ncbi:acyl-CoA dehydrogenase family protein [Natrinema sp. SYSU A 869]|uniref:acyl-CoA dehydrogenase family protein n=1 Tax=Natrinema sp. SYSU A 869 TaxID=2871694 RepID=UPI001CA3B191|nr:acyl-CoA dehydrogenase family protein [Natrinema sp. SYSU A 869]
MDFRMPEQLQQLLEEIDAFIEDEIEPLQREHERFFDHRREDARTNWEDGTPTAEWEALLEEMRRRADEAGLYRYMLPEEYGGRDGSNLGMAVIREHLAQKGIGLHNVLQQEAAVVGNFNVPELLIEFGSEERKERHLEDLITGETTAAFGLTEPEHGSDATHMDTTAEKDDDEWVITGAKRYNSGLHTADYDVIFARTDGDDGDHEGITAFWVPTDADGLEVEYFHWTFNMPTDHAEVTLDDVRVPEDAILGEEGRGLQQASYFVHEGRIRQAASSVGAAQFCIDEAVEFAKERRTWDEPLAKRQGIQFPLADLHTEAEMVRNLVYKTAWQLDEENQQSVSDKVSMANYRANLLACDAADRAMQVHGGQGYTRHKPFEHIYRHHRRYRITEGSEEIQKRNVAGHLFDYLG